MSDEGKYPFEGTPNLNNEFTNENNPEVKHEQMESEEEAQYNEPHAELTPPWALESIQYTKTELQMPYVIEHGRGLETPQESKDYDAVKDNNIETDINLQNEWGEKVWEAPEPPNTSPEPEIGDD